MFIKFILKSWINKVVAKEFSKLPHKHFANRIQIYVPLYFFSENEYCQIYLLKMVMLTHQYRQLDVIQSKKSNDLMGKILVI